MQEDTGKALNKGSNKEAYRMTVKGYAKHLSMQGCLVIWKHVSTVTAGDDLILSTRFYYYTLIPQCSIIQVIPKYYVLAFLCHVLSESPTCSPS